MMLRLSLNLSQNPCQPRLAAEAGFRGVQGDLICCESCPGEYHLACLGLQTEPEGAWHCPRCSCPLCGLPVSKPCAPQAAADQVCTRTG